MHVTTVLSSFWVYPTTDVHLVVGGPPLRVRLFDDLNRGVPFQARDWREVTATPAELFTSADPAIVRVRSDGGLEAVAPGTTTVRIERTEPPVGGQVRIQSAILRASVHARIDRIWAGNNQATVHAGASNYVVTIYARFTDGTIADISGHPYLRYVSDPTFVNVNGDGRLTGRGTTLGTPVGVDVQGLPDSVDPVTVDVAVIDPATELTPELALLHGSTRLTDRRNILLITEGVGGSELPQFRADIANEVARRLFRSSSHSPFDLLQGSFNLWLAMQPSPERGITVGPPIRIVRSAAEIFRPDGTTGNVPGDVFPLQARDSFFGLMYGARLGDLKARNWQAGEPEAEDLRRWIAPARPARGIDVDYRRLPDLATDPAVAFRAQLDAFFDRLGSDAARWKADGRDAGLVCFLVNDDVRGGQILFDYGDGSAAATVGHGDFFLDSLSNPPLHSARDFWDHEPRVTSRTPNVEGLTARVVHELGHSTVFRLGDEYENEPAAPREPPGVHEIPHVEAYGNLHIIHRIAAAAGGDPPAIDVAAIKWNGHRMESVAVMRSTPADRPDDTIVVPIERSEGAWATGDQVFLQGTRAANSLATRTHPLELVLFDPAAREAIVRPTEGRTPADYNLAAFEPGSILYGPRTRAGAVLSIIHAAVLADLGANGAFGQLTVDQCSGAIASPADNPADDPAGERRPRIRPPGLSIWVPDYTVLGLYEGGDSSRCRVYRPAGHCRMRRHHDFGRNAHVGFCFVCKHIIVDTIDPARHASLDSRDYPE